MKINGTEYNKEGISKEFKTISDWVNYAEKEMGLDYNSAKEVWNQLFPQAIPAPAQEVKTPEQKTDFEKSHGEGEE